MIIGEKNTDFQRLI